MAGLHHGAEHQIAGPRIVHALLDMEAACKCRSFYFTLMASAAHRQRVAWGVGWLLHCQPHLAELVAMDLTVGECCMAMQGMHDNPPL